MTIRDIIFEFVIQLTLVTLILPSEKRNLAQGRTLKSAKEFYFHNLIDCFLF